MAKSSTVIHFRLLCRHACIGNKTYGQKVAQYNPLYLDIIIREIGVAIWPKSSIFFFAKTQ